MVTGGVWHRKGDRSVVKGILRIYVLFGCFVRFMASLGEVITILLLV